jgi:hypothetical protein
MMMRVQPGVAPLLRHHRNRLSIQAAMSKQAADSVYPADQLNA